MKNRILAAWLGAAAAVLANQPVKVKLDGQQTWVDTGVDVQAGDMVRISAEGTLKYADARQDATPDGLPRGWLDLIRAYPLNDAGRGALIGRVGEGPAARPFLVGSRRESRMTVSGRLFVGVNQNAPPVRGEYVVTVEILEKAKEQPEKFEGELPAITEEILDKIPRRVVDKEGNEGDRINFLILGTEEQVKQALLSVGWVAVDRSVKESVLRGALGTLSRQAYLTMPMSELYVFGRPQDYGFAMSDPVMTVAERHHFRIWKAPFDVGGLTLWVGAGTHDVGFDRDQRTGGITHRIDPDTDRERDFIGETLKRSGMVVKTVYVTPKNTVTKAKTAHGQEYFSDGRILVIYLRPDRGDRAQDFADLFCSVLKQNNPDGGDLLPCAQWIEKKGREDLPPGEVPRGYRLLVVPGIFNTCVSDNPAYALGRKVLAEKYGVAADLLAVPNDSSEDNARLIAGYLEEQWLVDQRPFILVGYSKGTPDIQTALALYPHIRAKVAAFVSTAGASGGSPIADSLPMQLDAWMGKVKDRAGCKGNAAEGFKSLRQDARRRFLSQHPHPYVPAYSLAAVIPPDRVPKNAAQTWRMLSAWDPKNDGQLLHIDQIVPESVNLGVVWSDHLNVALQMGEPFPRAALLEALYRFVTEDLEKRGLSKPAVAPRQRQEKKSWAEGWNQK
ncbi:MAG: LssY C-terminal domain-containing protein [Bryobacteraceae bacterium]